MVLDWSIIFDVYAAHFYTEQSKYLSNRLEQICILKLNGILKFMASYTRIHIFALLKPFHRKS